MGGSWWKCSEEDAHGLLLTDYLEKESTITANYYRALLDQLIDTIKKNDHKSDISSRQRTGSHSIRYDAKIT